MKWRRRVFFLLWILSLIGISFYGGTISYSLFWAITIIPVLSFLYLLLVFSQFKVYQEIESRTVVCKQPMPYYFILPNETFYSFAGLSIRLFSGFSYVLNMPEDEEYELLPGDNYTYHTKLVCKYRGEYEVGVKEIILTDFFKLFRFRYKVRGTIKALVYPRIIHKQELESVKDIINMSFQETAVYQTEPDVITREYVPGDAMKYIHWKASAKEQSLRTRNQVGERKQELLMICDTQRYSKNEKEYIPLENQILETILALGYHFAEKNISYSILWNQNGLQKFQINGISQIEHWYKETSNVIFREEQDVNVLMQRIVEERLHLHAQTIILIAHEVKEELMNLLQLLSLEGYRVVLYLITNKDVEEYIRRSNGRLKIIVLPIDGNLEELL